MVVTEKPPPIWFSIGRDEAAGFLRLHYKIKIVSHAHLFHLSFRWAGDNKMTTYISRCHKAEAEYCDNIPCGNNAEKLCSGYVCSECNEECGIVDPYDVEPLKDNE